MTAPMASSIADHDNQPTSLLSDARTGGRTAFVIAVLMALQIADGIDQAALSFVAPAMRHDLRLGVETIGSAFSASLIGTAIGAILFGIAADWIGRRTALVAAAASFSLGSFATIAVTSGTELVAIRLLTGVALGGMFPVVAATVLEAVPARVRATAVTLVSIGTPIGASLCGPLSALLEPRFGWRAIFFVGGVLPALLLAGIVAAVPARKPVMANAGTARQPIVEAVASLFRDGRWRATIVLWIAFVATAFPFFFTLNWLPSLARAAGLGTGAAALGPSVFQMAGLAAAVLLARLVDKAGLRALALSTALGAPAFLLLGQALGSEGALLLACAAAGVFSVSSINIIGAVAGMLYPAEIRARGVGWAVAVMRLGSASAPGIGGLLIARGVPAGAIFAGVALAPLLSGAALLGLWAISRRATWGRGNPRTAPRR